MRYTLPKAILAAALIIVGGCYSAQCASLQITPSLDNSVFSENNNSEALGDLYVGRTNGTSGTAIRRALMLFDVAGNVAAGATISSVTLSLTQLKSHFGAPKRDV